MKKLLSSILILLTTTLLFAQATKIKEAHYDIIGAGGLNIGKTNVSKLELKYPIDKNTIFTTIEQFEKYITNYKDTLMSSRLFQSIDMNYSYELNPVNNIYEVTVFFEIEDSNHLVVLPYPKYSSNSGFTLKLKGKDTNFLGTLNPLATDFNFKWTEKGEFNFGLNFSYDYPFKAGPFNAVWNNSFGIDYTLGQKSPTFGTELGILFTKPYKYASVNFGFSQGINYTSDFKLAFVEKFLVSTPIKIFDFPNFTTLNYTPYCTFLFDWHFEQGRKSPIFPKEKLRLNFGHSVGNSNITYNDNFRKGYSFIMSNDFTYFFQTGSLNPSFSIEATYFNNWPLLKGGFLSRFGIATRIFASTAIDIPNRSEKNAVALGAKIRGVLDNAYTTPCGIAINFDMPFDLFTTNFPWDIINFNMQVSPFIDIALGYFEGNVFNIKKGKYCAGMEILVNPLQFSSYTVRASVGFDVVEVLHSPNKFKGLLEHNEIYIGLDYHY